MFLRISNNMVKFPVKELSRRMSDQSIIVTKKTGASLKAGSKKPARPPFMKNVFLGIFDLEMLVYPELDKEGLQIVKKRTEPFKDYFKNKVDPQTVTKLKMIPNEVNQNLKNLGLYGQMVPIAYGGSDQTAIETACVSEVLAKDLNIALTLYSHNFLGVETLLSHGTQPQKDKYLQPLASGDCIAAFCLSESSTGSDLLSLSSNITPSDTNPDIYLLNGKKKWVINGTNANLFIVLAKCDVRSPAGQIFPAIRILLVDKDLPGVTVNEPQSNLGLNASNVCEVSFKDTPVDANCFIGTELQGFDIYINVLNSGRFNLGAITVSLLRDLLHRITEFVLSRNQFDKPLLERESVHAKLAEIAVCIYALESMTYLTAAILDNYESPDCALEQAIIKIFCFTEGRRCLDLIVELMGGRAFSESEIVQNYFKDFRTLEVFDGAVDTTKLFVSLLGIQHAGITMRDTVSKMRFPFEFPGFVIKNFWKNRRHASDNAKLNLNLYEQLHPSLTESANELEYCVHRFNYAVNMLMHRYGTDVVNQQCDLMRIADSAVKIYAMVAVLGRSSRSYCIGLRNAQTEMVYAIKLCTDYKKIVRSELNDVIEGLVMSGDIHSIKCGPDIVSHHGYFVEHPLERSF